MLDIDECKIPDICYGACTNMPGKFLCECPQGSRGDPHTPNGCVKPHASRTGKGNYKYNTQCV